MMFRAVHDEADLSAVPGQLRGSIAAALAKDPGGRPTAEDLVQ
jgi:hypothetical protein